MKKCIGYVYCDECGKNMKCNSKEGCPRQYESDESTACGEAETENK